MAYKRTGRPPGRPKTKEYVTLMARVSQDLADRAKRYAHQRRQSISEVLRGALELLVEEDRYRPVVSDTISGKIFVSDTNTGQQNMSDMNALSARGEQGMVSDTKEETSASARNALASGEALDPWHGGCKSALAPPFDPVKHRLGKLCRAQHAWGTTGQSLRANNKAGYCLACQAAAARAKRQAQRQAQRQATTA